MAGELDLTLRGPKGYEVARAAIEMMERARVWPTALNFELWLHLVADPSGALAKEIQRLLATGEPITDFVAEDLAQTFLPKARLHDQIKDAGEALSQELATVSRVVAAAQQTNAAYGEHLAGATEGLREDISSNELKTLVQDLSAATTRAQNENRDLEQRLTESTAEVGRLRDHLIQVRRDATTDGLTNLANRKSFDEELERACAEAEAEGGALHLAVLDIDHFKNFNDTWGHQTGDQVLRYVASVIGRVGAPPRFAARYGGEEFAMIFAGESAGQVERTLHDVREEVASRRLKRRSTNEDLGAVTISAGFAERRPAEPPAALMDRADTALYDSKRAGRNRVTRAERKATAA
ncbi:MAG TPA: diguanylate cyclase [Caulobacteraceae bacterium]|nr:diguanylate cyclase [Caulobacteraceae bacterium]